MAAMFNCWVWRPFGTMATPTLIKRLKPILSAGAARRGGLRASGGEAVARRDVEMGEEEELEVGGLDDEASDFGPISTCEATE